nr:hypothetical protein [Tanacetum cinerariifolium]
AAAVAPGRDAAHRPGQQGRARVVYRLRPVAALLPPRRVPLSPPHRPGAANPAPRQQKQRQEARGYELRPAYRPHSGFRWQSCCLRR